MGTLTAQQVIDVARYSLFDPAKSYWPDAELLAYLNEGQRQAVELRSDILPKVKTVRLAVGVKQSLTGLAADAHELFTVVRNMGTGIPEGGAYPDDEDDVIDMPGRAIQQFTTLAQTREDSEWTANPADPDTAVPVTDFFYDTRFRDVFYVFPAQPANAPQRVEIAYGAVPPDIGLSENIALEDTYAPALRFYVLSSAFAKDIAAATQAMERSEMYMRRFVTAIVGARALEELLHPSQRVQQAPLARQPAAAAQGAG